MESTKELHISGMACNGCRNKLRNALLAIDSIKDVIFKDPMAYEDTLTELVLSGELDDKTLKDTVESVGYQLL